MQFVEIILDQNETIIAEAGAMMFMDQSIKLETIFGDGLSFLHAGGTIIQKELAADEVLKLDTGCLVAMTTSINYDVEMAGNVKSALFGGEELFLATLKGPGHIWLQSLPFSRLANRMFAASGSGGSKSKDEGSILGNIGIGDFFGKG